MTKTTTGDASLWRFYLFGRDDAEEDFDADDYDVDELARKILGKGPANVGEDLRKVLLAVIHQAISADEFDGSVKEWRAEYEDELAELDTHNKDAARALWKRGYIDGTVVELEDEVVDHMADLVNDDEDTGSSAPTGSYAAYGKQGTKDAPNAWDDDVMEEYVLAGAAAVTASGWSTAKEKAAAIRRAAVAQAEKYMGEDEDESAWMDANADDAKDDGLNPEVAYNAHWRPAFVAATAKMLEEAIEEEID